MNLSSTELQQSQRSVLQKRCSATKFNTLKNTYSSFLSTKLKTEGYLLVYMDLIVFYVLMTRKILQMIFLTIVCFILDKSEIIANVLVWNSMKHAKHGHEFVSFGIYWSNTSKYKTVPPRSTAKVIVSSVVPKSVSEIVMLKLGEIIKPVKWKMLHVGCWGWKIQNRKKSIFNRNYFFCGRWFPLYINLINLETQPM